MKKHIRQCAALILALALMSSLARPAAASFALGTELSEWSTPLGTGTTLTSQSLWSASRSDLRTEHYVTYTPNDTVKPVVFSGTYVASTNTVQSAASQLESRGYRVAAALNGGFFNTDGTIVGMLMTDGVVRALDVENYTLLGFTNDGGVFIDESRPVVTAAWTVVEAVPAEDPGLDPDGLPLPPAEPEYRVADRSFPVAGFNAYRNVNYIGGLYLYNNDFSSRVSSHGTCVYAILQPVAPEGEQPDSEQPDGGQADGMRMNGVMTFRVVSVTDTAREGAAFDGHIPEGCYMLYGEDHENAELLDALRGLTADGLVTVTTGGVSARWADAAYGISGLYTLLRDGQIVAGLPTAANPYTAVGVKADGSAVFYTIDGRQSGYSIGASYSQVAQRLQELDCVYAVALDGGGSTTLGATLPGSAGFSVVNRPSEPGRRVNNTIALVAPDGSEMFEPGTHINAPNRVVLAGSRVDLSASAYDSAGRPTDGGDLSWTATGGTVDGSGGSAVYTAGSIPGVYVVAADPNSAGMNLRVVNQLSSLKVTRKGTGSLVTSLNLEPGDQVDLSVAGAWWNLPVAMSERDVSWAVDTAIGSIDENGLFTAGQQLAEGRITLTAGGLTLDIPVKVDRDCPFTDIEGHWSQDYITQMYKMGLTTGYGQPDGTALYRPGGYLTRAELLTFITRALGVDAAYYAMVEVPFADRDAIPDWAMPYVQAMYTLKVLQGSRDADGRLYANVGNYVTREETMTILGRVLAASERYDLSAFPDSGAVSDWAAPYVQTLVSLGVVGGSNGMLNPKDAINRAEIAKLLVEIYPMEKAILLPRLDLIETGSPDLPEP